MRRVLVVGVMVLAGAAGFFAWYRNRLPRAIEKITHFSQAAPDLDAYRLVADHAGERPAQQAIFAVFNDRLMGCERDRDPSIDILLAGLVRHPLPPKHNIAVTLLKARAAYPSPLWKPILDAQMTAPELRSALFDQVVELSKGYCQVTPDETLEDLLSRAEKLAPLDGLEWRAVLLRFTVRDPPKAVTSRLHPDDELDGRAWVLVLEGGTISKSDDIAKLTELAAPIWARRPPEVSDRAIAEVATWAKTSVSNGLALARALPAPARAKLAKADLPPGFLDMLTPSGNGNLDTVQRLLLSVNDPYHRTDGPRDYSLEMLVFFKPPAADPGDQAIIDAAVAAGAAAVKPLTTALHSNKRRTFVAARALARIDPDALLTAALPAFASLDYSIASDAPKLSQAEASVLPAATLAAFKDVKGEISNLAFYRALACPDAAVSALARTELDKRLDGAAFVDGVLRFMARRTEFSNWEIDQFTQAIVRKSGAGPALPKSLKRLLDEKKGNPTAVFWALKVVGLRACATICGKDAVPVLQKYATDPGGYSQVARAYDKKGEKVGTDKTQRMPFASLAQAALAHAQR